MSGAASVLVVDVGTSGVRSAIVRPDGSVDAVHRQRVVPHTPADGLVEVDGVAVADAVLATAATALRAGGPVGAVGITNQRATTLVWDRKTGVPVGPGIGWQDLRTVGTCLELQAKGIRLAPNVSATKLGWILDQVDAERTRAKQLCFGTIDSWIAWTLSGGTQDGADCALHVTDPSNAAVSGLLRQSGSEWDAEVLEALRIPHELLPDIVDSSGQIGIASALPGAPPITGIAGDQQASLVGQGATKPGLAKATFGTGGMLDLCTGSRSSIPSSSSSGSSSGVRGQAGTFPIIAWRRNGQLTWGVEAAMLSAGTCVEWLQDGLGLLQDVSQSAAVAAECDDAQDVWFVPALFGLGTPVWDFGARGLLLGVTRGTSRAHLVRAVLTGIAHRGADLLEAAEADSRLSVPALRVDGGMSANEVFINELAEATGREIELSQELEATTLGAGYLAGLAIGTWKDEDELAQAWKPRRRVAPQRPDSDRAARRARWLEARTRAEGTIPELSGIKF